VAVFAFYTLSGYLMTRVLNERYGFTAAGTAAFALNRVLRLWPVYLVCGTRQGASEQQAFHFAPGWH
jgi:peptidoglycan/LPS O-acetylase OafA/YrhL